MIRTEGSDCVPLLGSMPPWVPVMWCQKALRGRMAVGVQGYEPGSEPLDNSCHTEETCQNHLENVCECLRVYACVCTYVCVCVCV